MNSAIIKMSKWLNDTHKMLNDLPRWITLSQVSSDTGLLVSWLSAFGRGDIKDPGIKKVQILNDYLQNVPLYSKPVRIKFGEQRRFKTNEQDAAGVYIIWANDVAIYVGRSKLVMKRVCDHVHNPEIMNEQPTHIEFIYVDDYHARNKLESDKIKTLQPKVNKKGL